MLDICRPISDDFKRIIINISLQEDTPCTTYNFSRRKTEMHIHRATMVSRSTHVLLLHGFTRKLLFVFVLDSTSIQLGVSDEPWAIHKVRDLRVQSDLLSGQVASLCTRSRRYTLD